MNVLYVQINRYLLTYLLIYLLTAGCSYLLQGGRSIQSLHVRDFEPMHSVWGHDSAGSKAFGLGNKAPEAEEYLWNKSEIHVSPKMSLIPSGDFLQPLN